MDLAIYHAWIHCKGGGEKVLLELLENSEYDITVYTNKYIPEDTYSEFEEHDVVELGGLPIIGEIFRGATFTLAAMLSKLPMKKHDALVVSTGGVAEVINYRNSGKPLIGFCHTPLRPVHDEDIYRHKVEKSGFLKRNFYRLATRVYEMIERPAWKKFDHVIFNSRTTQERATSDHLIHRDKTSINHPGADTSDNEGNDYEKYFFYPSRFAYYKRQDLALDAYEKFREENPDTDFELVIAGGVNEEKQEYYEEIKSRAEGIEGVEVKSDVPGDEWEDLYRNAYSILFCAINEDWGIIPIEAGSYEKPIISVNEGGPTESVLHEETGLLVDDAEGMAEAMQRLAEDEELVREMGRKGKERSKEYTWDKFVTKFDEKINEVVEASDEQKP
jgi:glycosyltransferase involved in cell wall biosynthesis